MGKAWILGFLCLIVLLGCECEAQLQQAFNTYTVSSFSYSKTPIRPYDWRYIRVELPPWFSSMSLSLESDVNIDLNGIKNGSGSSQPMICFREGSPPLPDVHNASLTGLVIGYISNDSFLGKQSLQNVEKCYPMQKNISLRVTNEQISPGIWYFGLFNGIGPIRTQSKMINRGSEYTFSANVSVEGCMTSTMLGPFCNQTLNVLSCNNSNNLTGTGLENKSLIGMQNNTVACRNANGIVCHDDNEARTYGLDVMVFVDELVIAVANLTYNQTQPSNASLMCYVRHGAVPLKTVYDFSSDLSKDRLVIKFPKAGRWYVTIQPIDNSNRSEALQSNSLKTCYMLVWQMLQCPLDKAGSNCSFEKHILQAFLRTTNQPLPFESKFMPITGKPLPDPNSFSLEPLLSNFTTGENNDGSWTFFLLEIPSTATGGNIHLHLNAKSKINYELYARYGGLPTLSSWDYFYANSTNSSNGTMFFKVYDSSEETISFYMLYVRGGTWGIGVRQLHSNDSSGQTDFSLFLERCPNKCSSHGTCQSFLDISGLTLYSFCACDRNHGGFDCSVELVSHRGHIKQSIFLIASNAAAVLPAYWALREKAFAEWVLYTSSGISSALYHACDVGTWCVLSFRVLQFLDFWLSFMAVVSTFVYLSTISEVSKRTIHTVLAIVTALMAEMGPTKSRNISYVIGLGALGLLVGWLIEFCARNRNFAFLGDFHMNLLERWEMIKGWTRNVVKTIIKRFRWAFIVAGFCALAMAAVSWKMESTESYWIWHSLWHIFIYTSSFLFLCSKAKVTACDNERSSDVNYQLTRQNSFGGGEQRLER